MKTEEFLCYLHTITNEEFGFYDILDNFIIQNRTSKRNDVFHIPCENIWYRNNSWYGSLNFFHIPCENIKLNTLFIISVEIEPGKQKFSCVEAPLNTYLKVIEDEKMMKSLKLKESATNDYLGLDIENELTPIEGALHQRIKEIRDEKLNIILNDSPKIAWIKM